MHPKKILSVKHLSYSPLIGAPSILNDCNYFLYEGDFAVLLGSNGSGKSTLLKLISGDIQPSYGKIYFENVKLQEYPQTTLKKKIKRLSQNTDESLFGQLSILENYLLLKQYHEPHTFKIAHHQEKKFLKNYLVHFNEKLAHDVEKKLVCTFSGGEKQALALAFAVIYPPKILLLDEHTAALDPLAAKNIMALTEKIIKENQITCLWTTHNLNDATEYGNRILAIKGGSIYQEIDRTKHPLLATADLLKNCY